MDGGSPPETIEAIAEDGEILLSGEDVYECRFKEGPSLEEYLRAACLACEHRKPFPGLGFPPGRIINSLKMRMECGIGKRGHCNTGDKYMCRDGPVFALQELQDMPTEY